MRLYLYMDVHIPRAITIDDLEFIAETFEPEDLKNRVEFIPF